jgi:hypothetical protein
MMYLFLEIVSSKYMETEEDNDFYKKIIFYMEKFCLKINWLILYIFERVLAVERSLSAIGTAL